MKTNKWLFVLVLVLSFLFLAFVSCDQDKPIEKPIELEVTVNVNTSSKYYSEGTFYLQSDILTNSFDFSELFVVYKGNQKVWSGYTLDSTNFNTTSGGVITCTYQGKMATANIVVISTVYELNLSKRSISLKPTEVADHDFLQYFSAYIDGELAKITTDMISNGVLSQKGTYAYVVNFHGVAKSLTVIVEDQIELKTNRTSLSIKSANRDSFDYTSLFTLRVNGKLTTIPDSAIDISQVPTEQGKGYVYCTYEGKSVACPVVVSKSVVNLSSQTESITLNSARVKLYDYASLFTAYVDGTQVVVTNDMLTNNVQTDEGTYNVSLSLYGTSKSVAVQVVSHVVASAVVNYPTLSITAEQKDSFDFTTLFTLYVDDVITPVKETMLDLSALSDAVGTYQVKLIYNYNEDGTLNYTLPTNVSIVDSLPVFITHTDTTVYVNSQAIDLTTLFSIVDDGDQIAVSTEMLSGSVNYITAGVYPVTLTYNGFTDTANVTVKNGAIIRAKSNEVKIKVGTDKYSYDFSNDFEVIVNGVRITNIDQYINYSSIDFSVAGSTCPVTATVKYSSNVLGTAGQPEYETISQTINYLVVKNTYDLSVISDLVNIGTDVATYNPLSNVILYRNGGNTPLKLTQNASEAGPLDCYVKVENNVDLSTKGVQQVKLSVYVDGPENAPVELTFNVAVASTITVTANNMVVFTDQTIYTTDLFTISVDNVAVPVTSDMVSGYVDVFNAGIYSVKINYNGVKRSAKVTVLDKNLVGEYKTLMKTIGSDSTTDEDGYVEEGKKSEVLKDMIMNLDLSFEVNGQKGTIIGAVDQNTLSAKIGPNIYTLYYQDGVMILDPDNSIKMGFSDVRRPMVYFKSNLWNTDDGTYYQLSSLSQHVLKGTNTGFTLETFTLTNAQNEEKTFVLDVTLKEKTSSDTIYSVAWGYGSISTEEKLEETTDEEGKTKQVTVKYVTLTYNGKTETYKLSSTIYGKRETATDDKIFANKTFTGTFDGKQATLSFDKYEGVSLIKSGEATQVFKLGTYELSSMKNGGIDHKNKILFVYNTEDSNYYSYKFTLNDSANTFEVASKDTLFGYYTYGNDVVLFLDGYGTGYVDFTATSSTNTIVNLTYTQANSVVKATFTDAPTSYEQGSFIEFYVADLLNVLTVKDNVNTKLIGNKLTNQKIVDGALVNFKTLSIGAQKSTDGKNSLLKNIEITTANGTLSVNDMKKAASNGKLVVDTSCVKFNQAGLYKLSINLEVGGNVVTADYVVQVLDSVYKDESFANKTYKTVIGDSITLLLDSYGIASFDNGTTFSGSYLLDQSGNIVAKVSNGAQNLSLKVEFLNDLIAKLTYSGTINGTSYISADTITSATDGIVKVAKVGSSSPSYIYQQGKIVSLFTPNVISGALDADNVEFEIVDGLVVRVTSWSKGTLVVADSLRGTYTYDETTVQLDGFGTITMATKNGAYMLTNGNYLYVVWSDDTIEVFTIQNATLVKQNVAVGNAVLSGKSFTSTYTYFCDYESSTGYKATTTFEFSDGKVVCKSVSVGHDNATGEDAPDHKYSCELATQDGTYTVNGQVVTIEFSTHTLTFELDDLLQVTSLTCTSTTYSLYSDGSFGTDTIFSLVV